VNKTDRIEIAAADSGVAPSDAAKVIDSMLSSVASTLTRGEDVTIPGFGKFATVQRAARTGRNPATGVERRLSSASRVVEVRHRVAGLSRRLRRAEEKEGWRAVVGPARLRAVLEI